MLYYVTKYITLEYANHHGGFDATTTIKLCSDNKAVCLPRPKRSGLFEGLHMRVNQPTSKIKNVLNHIYPNCSTIQ